VRDQHRSNRFVTRFALNYLCAAVAVTLVTVVLLPLRAAVNSTTVALAFLLTVLLVAIAFDSGPALLASVLAALSFDFFFLPPFRTLSIVDPQNWVAIASFFLTAIMVGQLSARARHREHEAQHGRSEIERLYEELRQAFAQASQTEAVRQSEALKSALLDAVSHDMRTPLTSIKASATTLLDDAGGVIGPDRLDPEGRRELLEVIDEEADRLNRFVESLIELARIEAGEIDLRRRWGVVEEIVAAALKRAAPLTKSHQVSVEIEKDLPAARVDSSAITEVLYALLDNAAKYAPAGTRISVSAGRAPHESIQFAVDDEGPGVPTNLRETVFDKFFRAAGNGDPNLPGANGVGLGLAIARGIVNAHGGQIWVTDGPEGHGARFVFTVPVGDDEPAGDRVEKRPDLARAAGSDE